MRTGIIYGYTNLETGKMYIGQTIDPKRRCKQHLNDNYKTGWHIDYQNNPEKYEYSVIEYDVPEDKLDEREIFWINFFDSHHNGYNLTTGGNRCYNLSMTTREKMSESHKGKKLSNETKKKLSESLKGRTVWNKGITMDENFRRKLSKSTTGDKNSMFGKHFYTDGNKNIVAYECPEGFRPGKTTFKNKKCT